MPTRFATVLLLLALLSVPASGAEGTDRGPFRVGLLPTIASLSLLRLYQPLRLHLQKALGRPVQLYSAANFQAHYADLGAEEFDLVVTAPHFGEMAIRHHYQPLYHYTQELRPLIVVPKGSAIRRPEQLAGKRVLTANRLTAMSVVAERWLEADYHMAAGRDYQLVEASNHATAVRAVIIGDADAAISSATALRQMPQDLAAKVDILECRLLVPHQFTMAHARLGPETIARLDAALAAFPATAEGRAFFAATGFVGYRRLDQADIAMARPYAEIAARMIKAGP